MESLKREDINFDLENTIEDVKRELIDKLQADIGIDRSMKVGYDENRYQWVFDSEDLKQFPRLAIFNVTKDIYVGENTKKLSIDSSSFALVLLLTHPKFPDVKMWRLRFIGAWV